MDGSIMADFVNLISNVGFPIFACVMMFKSMEREQENHKIESDKWTEALNNNTLVMNRLLDRLDGGEKHEP